MVPVSWAFGEQLIHLNQLEDPTDWNQQKLVRCKETSCETYRSQPELAKTAGTSMLGNQSVQTNQPGYVRAGFLKNQLVPVYRNNWQEPVKPVDGPKQGAGLESSPFKYG